MTLVSCAVEGDLDEAVARRLLDCAGLECGPVYGLMGKQYLQQRIAGYAAAAGQSPWFVLVDLDTDAPCGAALAAGWLPDPPPRMRLRVAVREVEAWFLADRRSLARFLSISRDLVPRGPDVLDDPKAAVVGLARRSRSRAVREGIAPRINSGRKIGPLYVAELSRFVREHWDVDSAADASDSLARCLRSLATLR